MLKYRLIFGTLLIAALLGLLYADDRLAGWASASRPAFLAALGLERCGGLIVTVVLAMLAVLGTREMHRLFVAAGHAPVPVWPALVNVALVLVPFLAANAALTGTAGDAADWMCTATWLTAAFMGSALLVAWRREVPGAIGDIATTLLIVFYLGVLPQYMLRVLLIRPDGGATLLLYFLATVKLCDIGAFFTGRSLGRHKLIEWLSPKKTIEGLAGGVASSILAAELIPIAVRAWAPTSAAAAFLPLPNSAWVFGLVMALVGQAGDLLESLFKRNAQVKDSANAIPAFGGLLDILDSPLLAAPIAYWMLLGASH